MFFVCFIYLVKCRCVCSTFQTRQKRIVTESLVFWTDCLRSSRPGSDQIGRSALTVCELHSILEKYVAQTLRNVVPDFQRAFDEKMLRKGILMKIMTIMVYGCTLCDCWQNGSHVNGFCSVGGESETRRRCQKNGHIVLLCRPCRKGLPLTREQRHGHKRVRPSERNRKLHVERISYRELYKVCVYYIYINKLISVREYEEMMNL